MGRCARLAAAVIVCLFMAGFDLTNVAPRLESLESQIQQLDHRIEGVGFTGGVCFLFGAFCALWAQNTGRSAWVWFFMGALFTIITACVLLYKNSQDRAAGAGAAHG